MSFAEAFLRLAIWRHVWGQDHLAEAEPSEDMLLAMSGLGLSMWRAQRKIDERERLRWS